MTAFALKDAAPRVDYVRLSSGVKFRPLDPVAADISIEDVAHGLAYLNRFGGHVGTYSVAEHSIRVAKAVFEKLTDDERPDAKILALEGLLHDATEGLGLVDLPTPVKHDPLMAGYRLAEERLRLAVAERFGLPLVESPIVKHFDTVLLSTEIRDLLRSDDWRNLDVVPLALKIRPMAPELARERFLDAFEWYGGER